jgi:hypothetical protein
LNSCEHTRSNSPVEVFAGGMDRWWQPGCETRVAAF